MVETQLEGQPVKNARMNASSHSESGIENCTDTLIWIGKRFYSEILCQKSSRPLEFSYPPKGYLPKGTWPQDCYVHEAEIRGCCRKVPVVSNWLTPGESRVFLAHQNGIRRGCACLFGYYVFNRVEVVVPKKYSTIGKGIILPRRITNFEALRSCGRRPNKKTDTRAKYLVDGLAADILDIFRAKMGTGTYTDAVKRDLFEEAVAEAGKIHNPPFTTPHGLIRSNAKVRGELVLFNTMGGEYPLIARIPRAHFLGLLRVDGEKLMQEVEEWYNNQSKCTVKIPYCNNGTEWAPAHFAYEYGFSITCAEEILEEYGSILRSLLPRRSCTIPGIGTFTNNSGNLHFKPLVKCCDAVHRSTTRAT